MTEDILHASCVAVGDRGLLILGPAGVGKSALSIRLIALGAALVSDDRTRLVVEAGRLVASCPNPALQGLVEARGIGILRAPSQDRTTVTLAIDLAESEPERLPPQRTVTILGVSLSLVLHPRNDHFPEALMLYLRHGRQA